MSYDRVGDVQVAQGNLPEALKSYQASLGIRDRPAKSDPGNAGWQRDLSVSYAKVATVYETMGDSANAQDALAKGRAILAPLVAQYPDEAQWKKDLAWFDQQIAALCHATPVPERPQGRKRPAFTRRSPGRRRRTSFH